ncbi:hypothetical protein MMC30_000340 [Trapelia coarctata]|nr:hypothetical protein [Trapelia coarctata]
MCEKVYFDGYLPPQKRAVRISRLESYLRQLITYHANNREIKSENYSSTESPLSVDSLFDFSRPVPAKFRGLPAAPFLVPAALERLARSQFADVIEVVPGEADSFCAAAARKSGGLVVTGDSDLLVYDLGLNGGVVFLDQFELRVCDGFLGDYCLAANLAVPHNISRRLDVESVQRLAFELKEDPSITLQEAVQRSKKDIGLTGKRIYYQMFREEYAKESSRSHDKRPDSRIASSQILDPRLSELALQCEDAQQTTVNMYLPFLIEDPSRASAWSASSGLRILAYTLLTGLDSRRTTPIFLEYSRRDTRIIATSVCILDSSELALATKILNRNLVAIRHRFVTLSPVLIWRIFGMIEVFSWYMENGRTLPSHLAFLKMLRCSKEDLLSWQDVQLSAMLQAALYSTRLLKQVLVHVSCRGTTRLESGLSILHSHLENLPPLQELIPSLQELENMASLGSELGTIFAFVKKWAQTGQDEDDEEGSQETLPKPGHRPGTPPGKAENEKAWMAVKSKHGKLRRKDNTNGKVDTVVKTPAKRVQNIYGMLADTSYDP